MHSNAMVFTTAPIEVDPNIFVLERRVVTLRRMLIKWPHLVDKIQEIGRHYFGMQYVGILDESQDLQDLKPAPPPGGQDRHLWKHK
eukprot:5619559-Karenia_brevis.AAC.1